MHFSSLFILIMVLTVEISALIEGFIVHPKTIKCFLAIRLTQSRFGIHALAFDKLYFGVYLKNLLFRHYFLFLLDDGGGKRF